MTDVVPKMIRAGVHMCVCVCMFLCVWMCLCACLCGCMCVYFCVYVCICIYACMSVCIWWIGVSNPFSSLGRDDVWALDHQGNIYQLTSRTPQSLIWKKITGTAVSIDVSRRDVVWIIARLDQGDQSSPYILCRYSAKASPLPWIIENLPGGGVTNCDAGENEENNTNKVLFDFIFIFFKACQIIFCFFFHFSPFAF